MNVRLVHIHKAILNVLEKTTNKRFNKQISKDVAAVYAYLEVGGHITSANHYINLS